MALTLINKFWGFLNIIKKAITRKCRHFGILVLTYACTYGYKTIVAYGVPLNIVDENGKSALMHAVTKGDINIVKVLLNTPNKLYVNLRDQNGKSALIYACKYGEIKIVEMLLNSGANPNMSCNFNQTPLMYACSGLNNDTDIIELLLRQKDVDINHQDKLGSTALIIAARCGKCLITKKLLQNGADPKLKDKYSKSAYDIVMGRLTIKRNKYTVFKVLLEHDARPFIDNYGLHIFTIALNHNNRELLKIIQKNDWLLSNGRLKPECRVPCNKINLQLLRYMMKQGLFDWDLFSTANLRGIEKPVIFAIESGISPGTIINLKTKKRYSLLYLAFARHDEKAMEMLINRLYFFPEDYVGLCGSQQIPNSLIQSEVIVNFMTQPLSLFQWSFLTVSKALSLSGYPYGRHQKVDTLNIPSSFKRRLKFTI